jgi:osmotically inducible protein OsmC
MTSPEKVLYSAQVDTEGGRDFGIARSSDGVLDIRFSVPGTSRVGTNPEQLLAAAWSASFESAIALAAITAKVTLPSRPSIHAEMDLNLDASGYGLCARLNIALAGLDHDVAQALIEAARLTCPFSKAVRGNIDVAISLI